VALAPWTDTVLRSASVIYLVVGLSVPSAHRVIKFLDLLREENIGDLPLKLVANRYQGGNKKGSDISVAQFERATGKKVDFLIPNDYSLISMSHGQGKPAVRLEPNSPFTAALREMLAADLGKDMFGKARRGFFSFKKA
jgi:pilus assembly protein CpaE